MAGRNEEKLKKAAKNCKSDPATMCCTEPDHLMYMAEVSSVIIAAAGPYLLLGEDVVKACVAKNTHYLDVTGEIVYNRRLIDKYHEEAKEKGVMITVMVGFMSACSDWNLYRLRQELGPLKVSKEFMFQGAAVRGGGSFMSGFSQFEHMRTDEPPLLIDPFSLGGVRKCGPRPEDQDKKDAYQDEAFPSVWCSTGFVGHPSVRVSRRSCELFENSAVDPINFGEELVVSICDCVTGQGQAKLNAQMAKPPEDMRKIISNAAAMETGLMTGTGGRPGYGAPRETRALSRSEVITVAQGENGEWATSHFNGPEGYEFTAIAVVCGALVFLDEADTVNAAERGGVVTPAFAFHNTQWAQLCEANSWGCLGGKKAIWTMTKGKMSDKDFEACAKKIDEENKVFSKKMMTGEWATCELPELVTGRHLKK
mmetsp:Transcript_113231/g.352942  ORF Transcript_113231/g.352942 Transcript_113231/m.352942 type:complete len:424 (+) Transcript_113231:68-1339(+)